MTDSKHKHKLSNLSRILIAIVSLATIASLTFPFWEIHLWAPQYPEGLTMYIWHNKLTGDVQIINGLNHYIGMKMIKPEMFPEFKILGICIGIIILWGLMVAITGSFKLLISLIIGDVIFAVSALTDFWLWEYDYGHNLNPEAAIQVPGMTYQPPLIGYKTLLNFEAYSGPYIGGWAAVIAGATFFLVLIYEWRRRVKHRKLMPHVLSVTGVLMLFCLSACSQNAEPIKYGKDNCSHCNMTIMKSNFGGEMVTKKGKVYKFDDAGCLQDFLAEKKIGQGEVGKIYLNDIDKGQLVDSEQLIIVKNNSFRTPMASGIFAVKKENANAYLDKTGSSEVDISEWIK